MTLKGSKKLLSSTEDRLISRTWKVRGQGQGLDSRGQGQELQKLSSRMSSRPPPLLMDAKMKRQK